MQYALAALVMITGSVAFSSPAEAAAGINKQINFQGKVVNTDGTNVTNGSYNFLLCLYTTASPATACTAGANNDAVWRESKSLTVTDGVFQTPLGDTTALPGSVDFNTDNIYLGVNFNSNGQMTPLIRFTAVPYAFNADKVHGLTVTDTTGTLTVPNGKTISFADAFSTTGAFPLTLTSTASTTATLPAGTITLVDTATTQTLANKTIGSTGLVFSGAATDITTGTGESLVIVANGAGVVDIQDATTVDSLTVDTGGVSIAAGQSYTGSGAVTLSSGAATALTLNSGTTGTINIGTDASAETINIGNTGAAAKIIAIGNNSQANTITIGDASATTVSITDNNWSVTAGGVASFVSGTTIGSQTFTTNNIADSGALTIASGGSAALTLNSASGRVAVATGDFLALSVSGVAGAAAGDIWYDSAAGKFKINEGGTTKTLCNETNAGCGTGGSTTWDVIGDAAAAGAIAMNEYGQTLDWNTAATAAAFDGLSVTLTNDATTDSNTQRAMVVANQNDSVSTGTTETILQVVNRDADETVGSGLVIENTGAGTMTNALQILETAGTITTALSIGNNVTTGISIGTGVTTGISIASGGITSTGEILSTNTGTGLSLRVNDVAADTTPFVVDADGNVGIGTSAPSRILDIVQAASAPQLRLSKDLTYYSEFTVDAVGDLLMGAVGGDIRALSENVWVCDNDACPALTLTGEGNIFVENVLKFGNGVYIKNDSATELGVYDKNDNAMLVFDEI